MSRCRVFQVSTSSSLRFTRSSSPHDRHPSSRNQSTISGNLNPSTRSVRIRCSAGWITPAPAVAATSTQARRKSPPAKAAAAPTACASIATPVRRSHSRQILRNTTLSCRELANLRASTSTLRMGESNSLFFWGTNASWPVRWSPAAAIWTSRLVRPRTTQSEPANPRSRMSRPTNSASSSWEPTTTCRTVTAYGGRRSRRETVFLVSMSRLLWAMRRFA